MPFTTDRLPGSSDAAASGYMSAAVTPHPTTPVSVKHRDFEALDKQYLWHPFTSMKQWMESEQLVIARAKGVYLYDVEGNKYLDGVSSLWANIHGHSHPVLLRAIRRQLNLLDHSTFLGLTNVPATLLAERLVEITPACLRRVFYSDNGSTAVEIALKMSFQYWRLKGRPFSSKKTFIAFGNSYHGDTLGSVSVGGVDLFHKTFEPLLFKSIKAFYPNCYRCPYGKSADTCEVFCFGEVEGVLERHHPEICGVVVEPLVQGAAGILTAPRGFLKKLEDLCRRFNVHLIVDEVATGFGRTGTMFACEQEDVSPDFLALAKGLTGGTLPLAATLTTEDVFNAFLGECSDLKTFFHGHTYTGNPLACAAALASVEIFRQEKTLQKLQSKIAFLSQRLSRFRELAHVGDIRQAGFIAGIELVQDRATKTSYPPSERMGHSVILEARRRGVILRPLGDVIVLMPPLSISPSELSRLIEVTFASIQSVTNSAQDTQP